jgi:L-lactate dehydrogenase complex protein LldG
VVAEPVSAREEVLGRIRTALGPAPAVPEVPREYRPAGAPAEGDVVARFCERVADYKATVRRVSSAELAAAVAAVCAERGAKRLVTGPEPPVAAVDGVELAVDDPPLALDALDAVDGVLSGCALAIAETGTIVLDGGPASGRRAITLVPDHHVCVVAERQIVASVPDAVAALADAAAAGRPITLVSGPSATSDIELDRVEGVHGPRVLDVLVVAR